MGRAALFIVLGLGMAMGLIGYNIRGTTELALETNYTYYKYMYARNLARTAVHAALRKYDQGQNPDTTANVSFAGGIYRIVSLRLSAPPADTLWMTTRGTYQDTSYTMHLTLHRTTKPFPDVNAAIGIRATPVTFSMSGAGVEVNGNNHNASGTALVGSGNLPGVATLNGTDSTTVYNAGLHTQGGTTTQRISGAPSAVAIDPNTPNPAEYMAEYLASADSIYSQGTIAGNRTFGSASNPVIIICDSPADTNYKVRFTGNVTGYGILAVNGNLEIGGTFNWYGLVIVFGETNTVTFGGAGTPSIVGGLIVAQPGDGAASLTLKGTGNQGKVLYSSAALTNASNIGKLRYYSILDWYE